MLFRSSTAHLRLMKKLIEFLFSGCWHEWETIYSLEDERTKPYLDVLEEKSYTKVSILKCKKCGRLSTHKEEDYKTCEVYVKKFEPSLRLVK